MLCRILPSVLMALSAVVAPQIVTAEDPDQAPLPPGRPAPFDRPGWAGWSKATPRTASGAVPFGPRFNPQVLFKRLDANADGKVTADEIPERAPERLKALLKRADANGDRQITPDELVESIEKIRQEAASRQQQAAPARGLGGPGLGPPGPPPGPGGFRRGPRRGWSAGGDTTAGPTPPPGPRDFGRGAWGGWGGRADTMTGRTPPPGPGGFGPGPWAGWGRGPESLPGPTPPPGPRGFARRGWEGWAETPGALAGRGRGSARTAPSELAGARTAEKPQLVIYPISAADPESVLKVMQTLLAGEPEVRLAIDPSTGSLVVLAPPEVHVAVIRPTLEHFQRRAQPYGGPSRRLEPPNPAPRCGMLRLRASFNRWDTNGDQKLTFEEFAVGMMSWYGAILPPRLRAADAPPGPGRKPRPPWADPEW